MWPGIKGSLGLQSVRKRNKYFTRNWFHMENISFLLVQEYASFYCPQGILIGRRRQWFHESLPWWTKLNPLGFGLWSNRLHFYNFHLTAAQKVQNLWYSKSLNIGNRPRSLPRSSSRSSLQFLKSSRF